MATEYLDKAGLTYFWGKIKSYVSSQSSGASLSDVYPVGSIYMSVNNTDPGTLFGGTWEQLEDRFLLGAGSTYTADDTGGSATHNHNNGKTGSTTLTAAQSGVQSHNHGMQSHTHGTGDTSHTNFAVHNGSATRSRVTNSTKTTYVWTSTTQGDLNQRTATGGPSNNTTTDTSKNATAGHDHDISAGSSMPPSLVVYMWKRTA